MSIILPQRFYTTRTFSLCVRGLESGKSRPEASAGSHTSMELSQRHRHRTPRMTPANLRALPTDYENRFYYVLCHVLIPNCTHRLTDARVLMPEA